MYHARATGMARRLREDWGTWARFGTSTGRRARGLDELTEQRIRSEPAHTGLVELLDDPDATVRATACQALGQVSSPVAAELLRTTADEDEELAVRKAAERALKG